MNKNLFKLRKSVIASTTAAALIFKIQNEGKITPLI